MNDSQWQHVQDKLRALVKQARFISSDDTELVQGLASGEIVAAMSWRVTYATLHREGKPVAYMNPKGGLFTYVCGLVMHKDPSDRQKALALIDSSISDVASTYTIEHIGDEPANEAVLRHVPNGVFENLGLTRDVETFLRTGILQRRLPNKSQVINAWTEIREGL
jgi:spermidine/putrescine transport system substrate-binding protein